MSISSSIGVGFGAERQALAVSRVWEDARHQESAGIWSFNRPSLGGAGSRSVSLFYGRNEPVSLFKHAYKGEAMLSGGKLNTCQVYGCPVGGIAF